MSNLNKMKNIFIKIKTQEEYDQLQELTVKYKTFMSYFGMHNNN